MSRRINEIIELLESGDYSVINNIFTFVAVIVLRIVLELLISENDGLSEIVWHMPVHYFLFFLSLLLSIIILLSSLTGLQITKVIRVVTTGFIITTTVPLIDLLLSALIGYRINYAYATPISTQDLLANFLLFFGNHQGAPPGIRIEILVAMIAIGYYVFVKTASLLKSVISALLFYMIIFWIYFSLPFIIKKLDDLFGLRFDLLPTLLISVFVIISLQQLMYLLFKHNARYFKAIIKDIRLTRLLHYFLMLGFGIITGYATGRKSIAALSDLTDICLALHAIAFAWIFSVITNNLADIPIDRITNKDRPTVTNEIPQAAYEKIAFLALAGALVAALTAGPLVCLLIVCFMGNYYLYSMPPLRFKRVLFLSKAAIGMNSFLMILAGYVLAGNGIKAFPAGMTAYVLLSFTACINFIDLKDYEGDKAVGICTLPVYMGLKNAKLLIGCFFVISFALFPFFIKLPALLLPCIIAGALLFYLTNKRTYNENALFGTYLASLALALVYYSAVHLHFIH